MCSCRCGQYSAKLASMLVLMTHAAVAPRALVAATYHVNPAIASAGDSNSGTEAAPWNQLDADATAQLEHGQFPDAMAAAVSGGSALLAPARRV